MLIYSQVWGRIFALPISDGSDAEATILPGMGEGQRSQYQMGATPLIVVINTLN